jgi:hypothetical protein
VNAEHGRAEVSTALAFSAAAVSGRDAADHPVSGVCHDNMIQVAEFGGLR